MEHTQTAHPTNVNRFLRSVRVDRDWERIDSLDGYIVTPHVSSLARRISLGLAGESSERAWSLTGPYGTGKSAFALFLSQLLSAGHGGANAAARVFQKHDPVRAQEVNRLIGGARLLPVPVVARRAPLGRCLLEGILKAFESIGGRSDSEVLVSLRDMVNDPVEVHLDDRFVISCLDELSRSAKSEGFSGTLVILDELGKTLEHASRNRHSGDVFLLQELAENASRSSDHPLLVITILHQAFEQYAAHLDTGMRQEWDKVQGRFSDVPFLEPPEQLIALSVAALQDLDHEVQNVPHEVAVDATSAELNILPGSSSAEDLQTLFESASPLHPIVLISLPYLFRRLAQNERSLFTYLLSPEPFSVQNHLSGGRTHLIRVPDLFDYVLANLGGGLHRSGTQQRWIEVLNAMEEHPDLTSIEVEVIKTIGILSVLTDNSHLRTSSEVISFALTDELRSETVTQSLQLLQKRSIVVHRRFNNTYRVWEGSDIDIEQRLSEARQRAGARFNLASSLQRYLPQRPLVARRHSHQTGAIRYFDVRYIDDHAVEVDEHARGSTADGIILCCLPTDDTQTSPFEAFAQSPSAHEHLNTIVLIPQQLTLLREATSELVALHWVQENTPGLRDDRVARQELRQRLADIEDTVTQAARQLLDPRSAPLGSEAIWYWRGERRDISTPRHTAELLSTVMDHVYPEAPLIRSELVNRRAVSSAAAAARRNIIERMLEQPEEPVFGIQGFPPERAIYETVIARSGLHRTDAEGAYLAAPEPGDDPCNLYPVWAEVECIVFAPGDKPVSIAELQQRLSSPPYGLLEGVFPLIITAFLKVNENEVSFYRDGGFVPEFATPDFELMMRRPEMFAVRGVRIEGARKLVVQRLASSLQEEPYILPVVRALLRMYRSLPEHAQHTQRLSPATIAVRSAFQRAVEPERFLFQDLPEAVNVSNLLAETSDMETIDQFFRALNQALQELNLVTATTIDQARDFLLETCDLPPGPSGWDQLRSLSSSLAPRVTSPAISTFVQRVGSLDKDEVSSVETTLALIAKRNPRRWTDQDLQRFYVEAELIATRWRDTRYSVGELTNTEEQRSQELEAHIRGIIGKDEPAHVIRAALSRVLSEL